VPVLLYSLSEQRHHFLSEEFSEAHGGAGGLKLLGLLFDGNHQCFLKLTDFLTQACSCRERYLSLLPPLQEIFSMFEPALAFLAVRHGLPEPALAAAGKTLPTPQAGKAAAAPDEAATGGTGEATTITTAAIASVGTAVGAAADGNGSSVAAAPVEPIRPENQKTLLELERVIRLYVPKAFEEEGLSIQFYTIFWRLSLQDIFTPTEGYEKAIASISSSIKQLDGTKKSMERDRDHTHSRDWKALKKEVARLQDFHSKLKEEQLAQAYNHQKVIARLEKEKGQWFSKPGPLATNAFVAEMICPRVLTSHSDALFCCRFVRLLIKLRTPGFQLLDFYNSWTVMLTQCIRCCSEQEAQIFGVFLREMMAYILHLRRDEPTYQAEMQDNPAFHRNYYTQPGTPVEWTPFSDIRRGHNKWENRIFRATKASLTAEDRMERRNALLLLSQCHETFPVVEKYARAILQSVEHMRDQEEFSDVKTLANSLAVKLRSQRDRWLDKQPLSNPDGRREKKPAASASAAAPVDGKRAAEQALSDRRSRRESGEESKLLDTTAVSGGERPTKELKEHKEVKDGKDGKESKEAKTRDRAESKTPKEARESKEARTNEKESKRAAGERKDRERDKLQERSAKGAGEKEVQLGDRKRSSSNAVGSGASATAPPATHADDRQDKRRRVERDGDGGGGHSTAAAPSSSSRAGGGAGGASDRGASDRHSGYGHQPRNALTSAPETGTSSSAYYRSQTSSQDYRRGSGYSSHTGHTGHSGSRYDSHRGRR